MVVTPGGFDKDALDVVMHQDVDQVKDVGIVVGKGMRLSSGMDGNVQVGFTDVDTDVDWGLDFRVFHNKLTLPCYTGSRPR